MILSINKEQPDAIPSAVVLLGRGGYGDAPLAEMARVIAAVQRNGRFQHVTYAWVDQGDPPIGAALRACLEAGASRIVIAPIFVPMDRSLRGWIPKIVQRILRQWDNPAVEIVLTEPLGDHAALGEAVVRLLESSDHVDIRPTQATMRGEPAWSVLPEHRHHVLTCRGPRCNTRDAGSVWRHLAQRLDDAELGHDAVLVAQTGCLYPCNLGPVMVVYPEGTWYCGVSPAAIDRIVDEHLVGGVVVEQYARHPAPGAQQRPEVDSSDYDGLTIQS